MRTDRTTLVLALTIFLGVCGHGCSGKETGVMKPQLSSATITQYYPTERTKVVTDPKIIEQIISFFPNLGRNKRSSVSGAWQALVAIDFVAPDKTVVRVQSDFESWFEGTGNGDWPVHGDLAKFLDELFMKPD